LSGAIPLKFLGENPNVDKVLHYMAEWANLPEIDTHITKEQVSQGFRCWRESTSTSPLCCHLGLCRITTMTCEDLVLEEIWNNILQAQTNIITSPFKTVSLHNDGAKTQC
jgi:hypothetical protein